MKTAKEGIQKRRHILRRKKKTYMMSLIESGGPLGYLGETKTPKDL